MTEDPQEKSLDRLLAHLGTVEPDPAFNQRIAHAAKARAAAKRPQAPRPRAWQFATASALAIALATLVTLRLTHPAATAPPANALTRKASVPSAGRWGFSPTTPPHRAQALAPETAAASIQPTQPTTSVAAPDLAATQPPSTSPGNEARLASYPAPPAPLTEQERLLLRVVHAHDTVEEAMLKSDALSLEEQRAREEFERFFPPPVTPPTEIPSADPAADPNPAQTPAAPTDSLSNDTPKDNPGAPK